MCIRDRDNSISYLTHNEKVLLDYYRTLPNNTAKAVSEFCEKMNNQKTPFN